MAGMERTLGTEPAASVEAALFGRGGGLGSGIASGRDAAAGAAELIEQAQRILTELETGAVGVVLTIGPFDLYGFTIPAIPLNFKLKR